MKLSSLFTPCIALFHVLILLACAQAQGPLQPSGPPSPGLKTLEQIESRTAISSPGYRITNSGSYYFTASLVSTGGQHGLVIEADNVAVDLNGFILSGTTNFNGIQVNGNRVNLRLHNGLIRSWDRGVNAGSANGSRFDRLHLSHNRSFGLWAGRGCIISGCVASTNAPEFFSAAILAGGGSIIQGCTASGNSGNGIALNDAGGAILDCTSQGNGRVGMLAQDSVLMKNCSATENGSHGIHAGFLCTIVDCILTRNRGNGILAENDCQVFTCQASYNNGYGIDIYRRALARENVCSWNFGGAGLHVAADDNRVEGNTATYNGRGFHVEGVESLIVKNSARANGTNYVIAPGNRNAAVVMPAAGFGSADAWANFSH